MKPSDTGHLAVHAAVFLQAEEDALVAGYPRTPSRGVNTWDSLRVRELLGLLGELLQLHQAELSRGLAGFTVFRRMGVGRLYTPAHDKLSHSRPQKDHPCASGYQTDSRSRRLRGGVGHEPARIGSQGGRLVF
jgi:hypothetical protein